MEQDFGELQRYGGTISTTEGRGLCIFMRFSAHAHDVLALFSACPALAHPSLLKHILGAHMTESDDISTAGAGRLVPC